MQLNYPTKQPQWVVGQLADGSPQAIDTLTNELLAQQSLVVLAGVTDDAGDYAITATGPDGETVTETYTSAGSETSEEIADALVAAINASDDWANIATATDSGTGEVTLDFIHPDRVYTVTASVVAGTATITTPQAAGGTDIPLGVAVQHGSSDEYGAVVGGSTADADLAGVAVRSVDALVNDLDGNDNANKPGRTMSVLRQGACIVEVEDAVTKGAGAFVRIADPVTGYPLGQFRSDADGSDAIAMTGAKFGSSTTGRGLAILRLNRP